MNLSKISLQDIVESIKLTQKTLDNLSYVKEEYFNYAQKIGGVESSDQISNFLQTLKMVEAIESNAMESIGSFFTIYKYNQASITPVDVAISEIYNNRGLNRTAINNMHRVSTDNLTDEEKGEYRDGDVWVGSFADGVKSIEYLPPTAEEVPIMMEELFSFYNNNGSNSIKDDILIKPFIIHALLARIQPYLDGNKRLSRLLATIKMHEQTNTILNVNINTPIMYLSRTYKLYRQSYISRLVELYNNPLNDEFWNSWFNFNINTVNDEIERFKKELENINKIPNSHILHK